MIQADHPPATRQRLLAAAGEVFAERGFRRATVREICRKAHANVAAINYHFRDKEGLYAAVLREAHRAAHEKYPPTLGLEPGATAEQRLHAFIRSLLLRLFDPDQPAWQGLLMAREMVEPTAAMSTMIEEWFRPRYQVLLAIVRDIIGPRAPTESVSLCAHSVVGQCLHHHHGRQLLALLEPPESRRPFDVERVASHITEFTLGALRHLATSSRSEAQ